MAILKSRAGVPAALALPEPPRALARPNTFLAMLPALPVMAWVLAFILIPMVIMAVFSLWRYHDFDLQPIWNLDNYRAVFQQPVYARVMLRTLKIALLVTIGCVAVAYPFAYFLARRVHRWRGVLIILVMIPFWTSFLVRTYAWMSILAANGVVNSMLRGLGVIDQPIQLLYTLGAVVIAGIYLFLPFAVLSIYTSLEKLGSSLEEAAMDLGAGPWTTFRRVTLPLSVAGIQAAVIFVFVPTLGLFVTPALLGGANATMIGNLQVTIFKTSLDFALGSAVSFVVLAIALATVALLGRSVDLERVYAGGVGQVGRIRGAAGRGGAGLFRAYAVLIYLFLFLPVVFLILFSFSSAAGSVFPPPGYSLRWYGETLDDPWLMNSVRNSLLIAVLAAVISVVLAAPGAYAIVRYRFPGRGFLRQALIVPIIIPSIMLGFGLLLLFNALKIDLSIVTVLVGHVTYVLPYAFFVIAAQQYGFDRSLEEAAMDLGANRLTTFRLVTLPLMVPGLVAAGLFAFTLSLDEFIITFLLTATTQTLPLYVWGMLRTIVSPTVNAVATMIVVASFVFVGGFLLMQTLFRRRAPAGGAEQEAVTAAGLAP
ncbi:MAG: ABC transporter permease subunit [Candidatus Rokubacteria bacterium]|nr:ABC transporter permease subunit [Candidatus Rokubacteria bacterium]